MAKTILRSGYALTPANKQVSFAGVPGFNINGLLLIINRTSGIVIFDATDPSLDFASVAGPVVTLKYDTAAMNVSDVLTVIYDEQVQDGLQAVVLATAVGPLQGFPTAGYGSIVVELTGTFSITLKGAFSNDSTDGVDGTWVTAVGGGPEDANSTSQPATNISSPTRKRHYRATDGIWFRLEVLAYVSGTAKAIITRRTVGIAERGVVLTAPPTLNAGTAIAGGFFPAAGTGNPGASAARIKSAAGTNLTSVATGARNLYGGFVSNSGNAPAFLKLYDLAAAPVLASSVPAFVVMIPAGATLNLERTIPRRFTNGIAYAIVSGKTDTDSGAVAADDIQGELVYA